MRIHSRKYLSLHTVLELEEWGCHVGSPVSFVEGRGRMHPLSGEEVSIDSFRLNVFLDFVT